MAVIKWGPGGDWKGHLKRAAGRPQAARGCASPGAEVQLRRFLFLSVSPASPHQKKGTGPTTGSSAHGGKGNPHSRAVAHTRAVARSLSPSPDYFASKRSPAPPPPSTDRILASPRAALGVGRRP